MPKAVKYVSTAASKQLLSVPTLVESPFIIIKIGEYTFGTYTNDGTYLQNVTYPNFVKSINIVKINGTVNTYTINLEYQITPGSDPNMLEKIFSSITNTDKERQITISYGDWNNPSSIYKEERAIITQVKSSMSFNAQKISYTISCTSSSAQLASVVYDFPPRVAKPSDVLKEMVRSEKYGLKTVFTGMGNYQKVLMSGAITSDDKEISIPGKTCSSLQYIPYLVNNMIDVNDDQNSITKKSRYFISVDDSTTNDFNGTYFKITKINIDQPVTDTFDTYTIDIGYPGDNYITDFRVSNDDSWALLYNFASRIDQPNHIYKLDNNGNMIQQYSPSIVTNSETRNSSTELKNWWSNMTQFPIQAEITLKGLTRPSILMSYVRLNVYFYGQKHLYSGLYIITRQEDNISAAGYRTKLSLTRIGKDE